MKVKFKLWLEENGQVMGEGLYEILQAVEKHGSLNRAAQELKMSYRQAWGRLKKVEKRLGITIVSTQVGGESGGGTTLTAEGKKLMDCYWEISQEVQKAAETAFQRYFREE